MSQLKQALEEAGVMPPLPPVTTEWRRLTQYKVDCPYCAKQAELVSGEAIYPHRPDLFSKAFYQCKPCGAYVGCHPDSIKPLGRLADAELRAAKSRAHCAFDPIWRQGLLPSRSKAYAWLARQLSVPIERCHIGEFDTALCGLVVWHCSEFMKGK